MVKIWCSYPIAAGCMFVLALANSVCARTQQLLKNKQESPRRNQHKLHSLLKDSSDKTSRDILKQDGLISSISCRSLFCRGSQQNNCKGIWLQTLYANNNYKGIWLQTSYAVHTVTTAISGHPFLVRHRSSIFFFASVGSALSWFHDGCLPSLLHWRNIAPCSAGGFGSAGRSFTRNGSCRTISHVTVFCI